MTDDITDPHWERFWAKVNTAGVCWEWTASRTKEGYGRFSINGKTEYAHRLVWESLVGKIPNGYQIDHLCQNTPCCNPDHLEPVTPGENVRRGRVAISGIKREGVRNKTHCGKGHELTGSNIYIAPSNSIPECRVCRRDRGREREKTRVRSRSKR